MKPYYNKHRKYLLSILIYLIVFCAFLSAKDPYLKDKYIDIQHYAFHLKLNDTNNVISGKTIIEVKFLSQGLSHFYLDLIGKDENNPETGMEVSSITWNNKPVDFSHNNNRLFIHDFAPTGYNEKRTFTIYYSGIPEDGLIISNTKFNKRSFFGDNWPDRARHWLPVVDHPSDKAYCEFIITAPDHYKVIATGNLKEESYLGKGQKVTHWISAAPIATKILTMGAANFAVQYVDNIHGVSVQTWVYAENRENGFLDFAEAVHPLNYFIENIGPFSFGKMANVQSKTRYGGLENAGNVFYYENSVTGRQELESLITHEIAHQWFGNSATEADWHHIWLSEGFATYFTTLYLESKYGSNKRIQNMESARSRVLRFYERAPNTSIVDTTITELMRLLNTNSYQKGAWVLHMLRHILGDNTFWLGIQSYYSEFQNKNVLTEDFQKVIEKVSGKDLNWFFQQWIYQPGQPEYNWTWNFNLKNNNLFIKIDQVQDDGTFFKMPVDIGIYSEGNKIPEIKTLELHKPENIFNFSLDSEPDSIILDPDTWMLMKVKY